MCEMLLTLELCIKYGVDVNVNEIIKLNGSQIPWVKPIKHLRNFINKTLSDKSDCLISCLLYRKC